MSDTAAMTSALLGEEGSIVSIKYLTPLREEQSFEITHANYTTPSISTVRLMDNGVGYLRIVPLPQARRWNSAMLSTA